MSDEEGLLASCLGRCGRLVVTGPPTQSSNPSHKCHPFPRDREGWEGGGGGGGGLKRDSARKRGVEARGRGRVGEGRGEERRKEGRTGREVGGG